MDDVKKKLTKALEEVAALEKLERDLAELEQNNATVLHEQDSRIELLVKLTNVNKIGKERAEYSKELKILHPDWMQTATELSYYILRNDKSYTSLPCSKVQFSIIADLAKIEQERREKEDEIKKSNKELSDLKVELQRLTDQLSQVKKKINLESTKKDKLRGEADVLKDKKGRQDRALKEVQVRDESESNRIAKIVAEYDQTLHKKWKHILSLKDKSGKVRFATKEQAIAFCNESEKLLQAQKIDYKKIENLRQKITITKSKILTSVILYETQI